jgi:hypothetical protein
MSQRILVSSAGAAVARLLAAVLGAALVLSPGLPAAPAPVRAQQPVGPTVVARQATADLPLQPPTATAPASPSATWPPTETPEPSRTPTGAPGGTRTVTAEPSDTATPRSAVENEERPIIVLVSSGVNPGQPVPNATFQLTLDVKNVGEHLAENVTLSLSSDTFLAVNPGTLLFKNSIDEGDSSSFEVTLQVAAGATPGVHPLAVAMRWDDSYGGTYTDQSSLGIEVGNAGVQRPVVVVSSARLPGRVAPGVPFNLVLNLQNTGGREALNVVIVPTSGPLTLQGTGGSAPVTIPPGGTTTVSLRVMASTVPEPGATAETLELRYDGPDGQRYTETQSVGLIVTGNAAFQPLPIVAGYRAIPAELHPGEVFELQLEVLNVGVSAALRTIMALGGGGAPAASSSGTTSGGTSLGVFAPLDTSNVRFLGQLPVGQPVDVTQRLAVDGAAKPGTYVLEVAFSYIDADGAALQTSEFISLLVSRRVMLSINPIGVVTSTVVGEPVPFSVELINAGGATVNVTTAEASGGRSLEVVDGRRYVGPLDSGGADTLDATLVPKAPGEAQVTVAVSYLDDFNREQVITDTFDILIEAAPARPLDEEPAEPDDGNLVLRILRGLLGLGASPPSAAPAPIDDVPPTGLPEAPAEAP